jgi:hypothetical protein
MTNSPETPKRAQIAAAMRSWLRAHLARGGGRAGWRLANPLWRLSHALRARACARRAPPSILHRPTLTLRPRPATQRLSRLGLGLAGGGGGSPGR